jgi:hypothetical protein
MLASIGFPAVRVLAEVSRRRGASSHGLGRGACLGGHHQRVLPEPGIARSSLRWPYFSALRRGVRHGSAALCGLNRPGSRDGRRSVSPARHRPRLPPGRPHWRGGLLPPRNRRPAEEAARLAGRLHAAGLPVEAGHRPRHQPRPLPAPCSAYEAETAPSWWPVTDVGEPVRWPARRR